MEMLVKLKTLLAQGVDVNVADYDKRTALHLSCSEGQLEATRFLLQNGADPTANDRWRGSPLDDAKRFGNFELTNLVKALFTQCERVRPYKVGGTKRFFGAVSIRVGSNGPSIFACKKKSSPETTAFFLLDCRVNILILLFKCPNTCPISKTCAKLNFKKLPYFLFYRWLVIVPTHASEKCVITVYIVYSIISYIIRYIILLRYEFHT